MLHALESAAFASWPALEEEAHAGWLLRFGKGYTKRANSANAGPAARALTVADIAAVEALLGAPIEPHLLRLA